MTVKGGHIPSYPTAYGILGILFVVIVTQDVRVLALAEEEVLTMTC